MEFIKVLQRGRFWLEFLRYLIVGCCLLLLTFVFKNPILNDSRSVFAQDLGGGQTGVVDGGQTIDSFIDNGSGSALGGSQTNTPFDSGATAVQSGALGGSQAGILTQPSNSPIFINSQPRVVTELGGAQTGVVIQQPSQQQPIIVQQPARQQPVVIQQPSQQQPIIVQQPAPQPQQITAAQPLVQPQQTVNVSQPVSVPQTVAVTQPTPKSVVVVRESNPQPVVVRQPVQVVEQPAPQTVVTQVPVAAQPPVTTKGGLPVTGISSIAATNLPNTGIPVVAFTLVGLVPLGLGLRRAGRVRKENEGKANFIWQQREFQKED